MSVNSIIDQTTGKIADRFIPTQAFTSPIYVAQGNINIPGLFDIYVGADFVPITQIAIPAQYQNAQLYRVSISFESTYNTANLNPESFVMFASGQATVPGGGTPADVITSTYEVIPLSLSNGSAIGLNVILTCRGLAPITTLNLFLATELAVVQPGTINGTNAFYVVEAINAS